MTDRWMVVFCIMYAAVFAGLFFIACAPPQPQPKNMPTTEEVRQIMLDCEQYSPGRRCIFVAMVVPDFSESITKGE